MSNTICDLFFTAVFCFFDFPVPLLGSGNESTHNKASSFHLTLCDYLLRRITPCSGEKGQKNAEKCFTARFHKIMSEKWQFYGGARSPLPEKIFRKKM